LTGEAEVPAIGARSASRLDLSDDIARALLLLCPALLLMAIFFVAPIMTMLLASLHRTQAGITGSDLTLANYVRFLSDTVYYRVVWRTLQLGLIVTFCCLILGFPLAYSLARTRGSARRGLAVMLLLFPLMTSVVVRSYGWTILLGETGLVTAVLTGLGLAREPVRLLYTDTGTIIALVEVLLPFMVLSLMAVIQTVHRNLEEAARSLGAGVGRVFLDVVLPLSMPGVAAGSMLVFILAIGAFVTPALIGGARTLVIPMLVYQQAMVVVDWPFAAAISFIFLIFVLLLVRLLAYFLESHRRWRGTR
jgi:ABC-type spermidine/putrescine transport system permease subunit I